MKILGTAGRGFIVEVEEDEMAHLAGFYSTYSDEFRGKARVGERIPVSALFKSATETINTYRDIEKNLQNTQDKVARLLDLMAAGKKEGASDA